MTGVLFISTVSVGDDDGRAHLCQFGWCHTDMHGKKLSEGTLYLNPEHAFPEVDERRLAHSENNCEFYRLQPTLEEKRREIQSILDTPDVLIVGYNLADDQFNLISNGFDDFTGLDFRFYAAIYYENMNHTESLRKLSEKLGVSSESNLASCFAAGDYSAQTARAFFAMTFGDANMVFEAKRELVMSKASEVYDIVKENVDSRLIKSKWLDSVDWAGLDRYFFFDIECSNCKNGNGKICEFGYLVTDTDFKVLEKNEFIVNPGRGRENDFNLLNRPDGRNLHLRYEAFNYRRYRTSPEFGRFIPTIHERMHQPKTLIFGYAVSNDLRYLDYGYERYYASMGIDYPEVKALDVQNMFNVFENTKSVSLEKALESLGGKEEEKGITYHNAKDDAEATMLVLKHMTEKSGKTVRELALLAGQGCVSDSDHIYLKSIHTMTKEQKRESERLRRLRYEGNEQ